MRKIDSYLFLTHNKGMEIPIEMRQNYLERRFEELSVLRQNIKNPDFLLLKKCGHQIKGNARSFDFDDLTKIAIQFEEIAESKNQDQLLSAICNFENCLNLCAQRLSLEKAITDK